MSYAYIHTGKILIYIYTIYNKINKSKFFLKKENRTTHSQENSVLGFRNESIYNVNQKL